MKKIILKILKIILMMGLVLLIIISGIIIWGTIMSKYEKLHVPLGNGYELDRTHYYPLWDLIYKHGDDCPLVIVSAISEYAYDSVFVILSQQPFNELGWDITGGSKVWWNKEDSIFDYTSFHRYFIFNLKEKLEHTGYDSLTGLAGYSNLYGPFNKEEFLRKLEELGVPKELQLKCQFCHEMQQK